MLLDYLNAEKSIHPLIAHLTKFGVSQFRILQLMGTRELILEYPGSLNTEHQYLPMLVQFGVSLNEVSRCVQTGGLSPRSSRIQNSKIQTLKLAHLFWDFTHWNFAGQGFGTCEYKRLASRYLGYRNSKILYLLHTIIILGFRKSGFRDLRVQGNTPLGIPSFETPKCPNSSTCRHFGFS